MAANARQHHDGKARLTTRSPLTGKIFDAVDEPMSPTTSRGKSDCKYRYYVSASLQQGRKIHGDTIRRLNAVTVERIVTETLARWLPLERSPLDHLASLCLHADGLLFELARITPARLATGFPMTSYCSTSIAIV